MNEDYKKVIKIDNVDIDLNRRNNSLKKTIDNNVKDINNSFDKVLDESIKEIKKATSNIYIPTDLGDIDLKKQL